MENGAKKLADFESVVLFCAYLLWGSQFGFENLEIFDFFAVLLFDEKIRQPKRCLITLPLAEKNCKKVFVADKNT